MSFRKLLSVLLSAVMLIIGYVPIVDAEYQFPQADKISADKSSIDEIGRFYDQIEEALKKEDIDKMMGFYADDYLYHGITKKQLKFMWLEIFSNYTDLYSVHIFTKIDVHGDDAISICTGGLFGTEKKGEDYQVIDRWITHPHWLTRVNGEWKMIGGGTHETPGRGGLDLHPLF
jgi:ketosteroid isomerase-like protein